MIDSGLAAWVYNQFYCRLIGTALPAHWFGPRPPAQLTKAGARLSVEIVSHCWQYAHLSVYQLSSLVKFPPQSFDLTYTLYYSEEDIGTVRLVDKFSSIEVPNLRWNFQIMDKNELFRRAIGRNLAALNTTADWIFFSDCDLIFHQECLESMAQALRGVNVPLAYPKSEQVTDLLSGDDPMINLSTESPEPVDIDPSLFHEIVVTKAKGTFQIVHGDVARQCGYCKDLSFYQRPTSRWRKTFEDTAFRRVIADEGLPIPMSGLHRIRHQEKGRYAKDSKISDFRTSLRQMEERQMEERQIEDSKQ